MIRQLFARIAVPSVVVAALVMAGPAGAQPPFRGWPPPVVGRGWVRPGGLVVTGRWPFYWRGYYRWHYFRPQYVWGNYYSYYTYFSDSYDSYASSPYPYDYSPSYGSDPYSRTYVRCGSMAELWASGFSYQPASSSPGTGEVGPFQAGSGAALRP